MKIICHVNSLSYNRILISTVRKYGKAVVRNRVRRQMREIYRLSKDKLKTGYDIIIILYPGDYSYSERNDQLLSLLKKSGIFTQNTKERHIGS